MTLETATEILLDLINWQRKIDNDTVDADYLNGYDPDTNQPRTDGKNGFDDVEEIAHRAEEYLRRKRKLKP